MVKGQPARPRAKAGRRGKEADMRHQGLARIAATLGLATLALGAVARGGTTPSSGPPVGGKTRPFSVQDVTGQAKGKQLCYV
jgi:hypothetical protein